MSRTPKPKKACSIEGCDRPSLARSWCSLHYKRWEIHGDPNWKPAVRTLADLFYSKIDVDGPIDPNLGTACWIWNGARAVNRRYGTFHMGGRTIYAHRFSYELATGEPLGRLKVDHRCFNEACVNPDHLRLATNKQNMENRSGPQRNNLSSGVRGVYRNKRTGRWYARVKHCGKIVEVGTFARLEDAEAAVIAKRNQLFTHNDRDRVDDKGSREFRSENHERGVLRTG